MLCDVCFQKCVVAFALCRVFYGVFVFTWWYDTTYCLYVSVRGTRDLLRQLVFAQAGRLRGSLRTRTDKMRETTTAWSRYLTTQEALTRTDTPTRHEIKERDILTLSVIDRQDLVLLLSERVSIPTLF